MPVYNFMFFDKIIIRHKVFICRYISLMLRCSIWALGGLALGRADLVAICSIEDRCHGCQQEPHREHRPGLAPTGFVSITSIMSLMSFISEGDAVDVQM